ncbi:MAG: class I SAM-dependent methyltransferase [Capsulimonadales bacterium]|nr:class I SAM-dependent methyltransferase [Capsulimonadales bacterium]
MSVRNFLRRQMNRLIEFSPRVAKTGAEPFEAAGAVAEPAAGNRPEVAEDTASPVGKVLARPDRHREAIPLLEPSAHVAEVELHYNQHSENYQAAYGTVLQAVRSADVEDLLRHEMNTMRLADGMRLLDAGCGFCGPSIWFAGQRDIRVTGVTLAENLVREAKAAVDRAGMSDRITVLEGDYHYLPSLVSEHSYDRVMFMETIGYAHTLPMVLEGVHRVLKPGGYLYIKDYFRATFEPGSESQKRVDAVLAKVYEEYRWVTFSREELVRAIEEAGFVVEHAEVMPFGWDAATVLDFDARAGFIWTQLVADGFSFGLAGEVMARRP